MKELKESISICLVLILTCCIASPIMSGEKIALQELSIAHLSNTKETSEKNTKELAVSLLNVIPKLEK